MNVKKIIVFVGLMIEAFAYASCGQPAEERKATPSFEVPESDETYAWSIENTQSGRLPLVRIFTLTGNYYIHRIFGDDQNLMTNYQRGGLREICPLSDAVPKIRLVFDIREVDPESLNQNFGSNFIYDPSVGPYAIAKVPEGYERYNWSEKKVASYRNELKRSNAQIYTGYVLARSRMGVNSFDSGKDPAPKHLYPRAPSAKYSAVKRSNAGNNKRRPGQIQQPRRR